jgi:hypothetical protein
MTFDYRMRPLPTSSEASPAGHATRESSSEVDLLEITGIAGSGAIFPAANVEGGRIAGLGQDGRVTARRRRRRAVDPSSVRTAARSVTA